MKKNKTMRIASVLLIAVLLTTSIISGTFAKYVTTGEVADSARVAKFGVTISGEGSLFAKTYYRKNIGNTPGVASDDPSVGDATLTVESSGDYNVVAPGTQSAGNGMSLGIEGSPEVDVKITFDIDLGESQEIFLKGGTYPDMTQGAYATGEGAATQLHSSKTFDLTSQGIYYPIVFTLGGKLVADNISALKADGALPTSAVVDEGANTVSGNLAVIKAALGVINGNDGGIYVDANTDLSTVSLGANSLTLSWTWPFDCSSEKETNSRIVYGNNNKVGGYTTTLVNQMDTLLGDLAANTNVIDTTGEKAIDTANYSTEVKVALTVTVTQVD